MSTWVGTSSGEPKKRALSLRVWAVSVLIRVRLASEEPGSLKARWPSEPMPSNCTSMPPARRDQRLVALARRRQPVGTGVGAVDLVRADAEAVGQLAGDGRPVALLVPAAGGSPTYSSRLKQVTAA